MINHTTLLGSIAVIALLLAGTFFYLNNGQSEEQNIPEASEPTPLTPTTSQEEARTVEVFSPEPVATDIEEANEPKEKLQSAVTPPLPAPTPLPTPTPAPTGYTLAEVALHADSTSCWTIIDDGVYDVTPFISMHPGGERNIMKICGKDGTSLFMGQHGGDGKPAAALAKFRIGAYRGQ
jgi:cytochrome b involved in lipid metabolism